MEKILAFSIISGSTLDSMLISYWRSIHNTDRLVRRNFIQSSIRIILVCSTVAAVSQHPGVPDMSRSNLESIYDMVLCSVPNLNAQLSITMTLDNFEFRQPISRDGREWTEPALYCDRVPKGYCDRVPTSKALIRLVRMGTST